MKGIIRTNNVEGVELSGRENCRTDESESEKEDSSSLTLTFFKSIDLVRSTLQAINTFPILFKNQVKSNKSDM